MEPYGGVLSWGQRQRVEALKEARSVIGGQAFLTKTILPETGNLVYVAEYIIGGSITEEDK